MNGGPTQARTATGNAWTRRGIGAGAYLSICWGAAAVALAGGVGPGDIFPGAAFTVLTAPVSLILVGASPPSWRDTVGFSVVFFGIGPAINFAFWWGLTVITRYALEKRRSRIKN